MPVAKHRTCSFPDAMKPEQKAVKPEKEGHYSLDNFIRQAIGKEPFLSFSRAGESPVQWIQLLHALDQQGTNKLSKGPKVDNKIEGKEHSLEPCNGVSSFVPEMSRIKESVPSVKGSGVPENGTKITPEHMQTLKIPEAVVAFAQAAAKANSEPEKYLPGWPLLSPSKLQMQKCDKCSREFCSPINYRRHIRVHRRSLNIDKDFPKNREFLGVFWDKLSLDEAREIVSFKNVTLEEVAGSSIIKALTSFIRKPGFSSLPQTYIKAGAALLDVVQARSSGFPISSHELFSILDDASEKTFLCAGTALSMQKFVFDGEAGKIGLEIKNLVACTSFLVEQKLVKAWLADKDAEALRCQKLLVEEEEAAQKRQAELLERKRLKKLRQKEQKAKEQVDDGTIDLKENLLLLLDPVEAMSIPAETPALRVASESNLETLKESLNPIQLFLEPAQSLDADVEATSGSHSGSCDADVGISNGNIGHQVHRGSSRHQLIAARRQVSKLPRNAPSGLQRTAYLANGHKVWTRKTKPEIGEDSNSRVQKESRDQPDQNSNQEVLIGSICVTLVDCNGRDDNLSASLDQCTKEKPVKLDAGQNGANRPPVKLWRPVGRLEVGVSATVESEKREAEGNGVSGKAADRILDGESYLDCIVAGDNSSGSGMDSPTVSSDLMGPRLFSSRAAEAFLAQRWKEAIAADHVKLVLSPETEPSDCFEILEDAHETSPSKRSILGSAENRLAMVGKLELSTMAASKPMFRAKPDKGSRLKYIPKHRKNG